MPAVGASLRPPPGVGQPHVHQVPDGLADDRRPCARVAVGLAHVDRPAAVARVGQDRPHAGWRPRPAVPCGHARVVQPRHDLPEAGAGVEPLEHPAHRCGLGLDYLTLRGVAHQPRSQRRLPVLRPLRSGEHLALGLDLGLHRVELAKQPGHAPPVGGGHVQARPLDGHHGHHCLPQDLDCVGALAAAAPDPAGMEHDDHVELATGRGGHQPGVAGAVLPVARADVVVAVAVPVLDDEAAGAGVPVARIVLVADAVRVAGQVEGDPGVDRGSCHRRVGHALWYRDVVEFRFNV